MSDFNPAPEADTTTQPADDTQPEGSDAQPTEVSSSADLLGSQLTAGEPEDRGELEDGTVVIEPQPQTQAEMIEPGIATPGDPTGGSKATHVDVTNEVTEAGHRATQAAIADNPDATEAEKGSGEITISNPTVDTVNPDDVGFGGAPQYRLKESYKAVLMDKPFDGGDRGDFLVLHPDGTRQAVKATEFLDTYVEV